jgi:hypothetical protein
MIKKLSSQWVWNKRLGHYEIFLGLLTPPPQKKKTTTHLHIAQWTTTCHTQPSWTTIFLQKTPLLVKIVKMMWNDENTLGLKTKFT